MDIVESNNQLLKELYKSKWNALSKNLVSINESIKNTEELATCPLLLKTNALYENADIKIMFLGQETNKWHKAFGADVCIEDLLEVYQGFYLDGQCFEYGGYLFNFIKEFQKILQADIANKKIGFLWNNVQKIGKSRIGTPCEEIRACSLKCFNVIAQEIEILKPNVLLFLSWNYVFGERTDIGMGGEHLKLLSGNYVDGDRIGKYSEEEIIPKLLFDIKFENIPSVKLALRTHHPNYLMR
jgi:hypothetical protein